MEILNDYLNLDCVNIIKDLVYRADFYNCVKEIDETVEWFLDSKTESCLMVKEKYVNCQFSTDDIEVLWFERSIYHCNGENYRCSCCHDEYDDSVSVICERFGNVSIKYGYCECEPCMLGETTDSGGHHENCTCDVCLGIS